MHGHPMSVGRRGHRGDFLGRAAGPSVTIVRVLHTHEASRRNVDVARPDIVPNLGRGEEAALGGHGQSLDAAEDRGARPLVVQDVRVPVEDDLLAGPGLGEDGDQVALCPRGDEEGSLLARASRGQLLEAPDGGVFLPDIVADLGAGHRLPHGRGGQSERVGAKVDDVVHGYLVAAACRRRPARRPHSV